MAQVMADSPVSNNDSVLDSVSSAYELDLPSVPCSLPLGAITTSSSSSENSQSVKKKKRWTSKLRSKSSSPVYCGGIRSATSPIVTTPELELSVIHEQESLMDSDDSDSSSGSSSESDREIVEVYGNLTSLGASHASSTEPPERDRHLYTQLLKNRMQAEVSNYATPSTISDQSAGFSTNLIMTVNKTELEAEDSDGLHQTSYVMVDNDHLAGDSASTVQQGRNSWRDRWARQKWSKGRHRTWRLTFQRMSAVRMSDATCCLCGSRKQAKIFYGLITGLILLLLIAVAAVLVASLSWRLLDIRASSIQMNVDSVNKSLDVQASSIQMNVESVNKSLDSQASSIQMNVDNVNKSLEACRVGRNWVSIPIRTNSTPLDSFQFTDSSQYEEVSLSNLTYARSSCDSSQESSEKNKPDQLLVYVVLRTNLSESECLGGLTMPLADSFTSISIWTTRRRKSCTYRQYMSILNDNCYPQLASRSFWIPLRGTGRKLFMNAQLMEGNENSVMNPVDVTLYVAGYC